MIENNLKFLCLSLRGSERVATEIGSKLDKVIRIEQPFAAMLKDIWIDQTTSSIEGLCSSLLESQATSIFSAQFKRLFSKAKEFKPKENLILKIEMDGVNATFLVKNFIFLNSTAFDFDGVEGDDLVVILALKSTLDECHFSILGRYPTQESMFQDFLKWNVGFSTPAGKFSESFKPGMYIVDSNLTQFEESTKSHACVTAYYFYSWLVTQRAERNLLFININGDLDNEIRKLILIKKQIVSVRKIGLLKNRAFPGSTLLTHNEECLKVFRLEAQSEYLCSQYEETAKALEMQNSYITSGRIKSIETIIFVSTVLGLGIAINALQMKPFYDANTENALHRPIFWIVLSTIIFGGIFLWGIVNQWRRTRKVIRWLRKKFKGKATL
jgi:hypothetical protein